MGAGNRSRGDEHKLQYMEVLRMQRQTDEFVPDESGDRVLNFGQVRVHNRHIQSGKLTSPTCAMCVDGLESAIAPIETFRAPSGTVELASGDGANKDGDPSPSSGDGENKPDPDKLLGDERGVRHTALRPSFE